MNQALKLIFMNLGAFFLGCRARPDTSAALVATASPALKGRVAVFDIYDRDRRLTRQAPGVLVSTRAAVLPAILPEETAVLADAQRQGQLYIPLPAANESVSFIGLEAELPEAQIYADVLPPLSAQELQPIGPGSRITKVTEVIMYNEFGFVQATARPYDDGKLVLWLDEPRAYPRGGILAQIYNLIFASTLQPPPELSRPDALKMIRKGGAIIAADPKYDGIVRSKSGRNYHLKYRPTTGTIDILGFVGEDMAYEDVPWTTKFPGILRKDLLPAAIATTIDSVAVKMKVSPDIEREILQFLDCDK